MRTAREPAASGGVPSVTPPEPAPPVAQRRAARHARLLEVGLEAYGTEGYRATSVKALCDRARLSTRQFYEVFANREDVLITLHDRAVQDAVQRLATALGEAPPSLADRVEAGVRAYVEAMAADRRTARLVHLEVVGVSPAVEARRRAALHLFADLVVAQVSEVGGADVPAEVDLPTLCLGLIGAANEVLVDWAGRPDGEATALVPTLTWLFQRALTT